MAVAVSAPPSRHGATRCTDADPLVAARHAFYTAPRASTPHQPSLPHNGEEAAPGDLGRLLEAEYSCGPRSVPTDLDSGLSREDVVTAALRQACRLAVPLTPDAVLTQVRGGPRTTAVLSEMWPQTVQRYGTAWAEEALHRELRASSSGAERTALLLDLAEATGVRPVTAADAAALASAGDRGVRHAAWRYLHRHPDGAAYLPDVGAAADVYERLLLGPLPPVSATEPARPGLVIAQAMLVGGLETPGQGQSGGLSVLLGGLGDHIAAHQDVAAVVTVVPAGHEALIADPRLLRERRPGHLVLHLPVDAPAAPQQHRMHEHRAALAWWATRLLRALRRPVDVLHLRYADDGSLALAQAARRIGTRLVFTAAPDPHREISAKYARAGRSDAEAAEPLRHDLHRVFLADRLVDHADTVIGIPGREGTQELVRYFPVLGTRYGTAGPAAPPEGIAPYLPAAHESTLRREMLAELFSDGDRGDALAPGDRELPLLLCVGRLHPVKQQDLLLRAWLATGLWRRTTLVLVGGATDRPTPAEQQMRTVLRELVEDHPAAARRLALLPAMPNDRVRRLERALADPAEGIRAWYVCPSSKEEFGIAILEAMEAGLPAAAPRRGGVGHYLSDGINGMLMDTASSAGLAQGLRRLTAVPESRRRRLARAARQTATVRFAVTDMADALVHEYARTGRTSDSTAQ
ncbi:glycosyltransferase family 4 protein [Streptomyces sp. NPDC093248]|uniref:glycosyltransferase family 4 protein n=1 Tax=Streptomyces sp. NPDC093248 TaxID=3155072 RepID=UPI0034312621